MKRTSVEAPYLSWAIIARNCADTLEGTLRSIRARTPDAEIVVVDTCSNDFAPVHKSCTESCQHEPMTHSIAKKYADVWEEYRGPAGDWSREMLWFSDAAAARNRAFSLAHGKWRAWIDTDDELPDAKSAERLLKVNNRFRHAPSNAKQEDGPDRLEDTLRWFEEKYPDVQCINAPYLYEIQLEGEFAVKVKDAKVLPLVAEWPDGVGKAEVWQDRERIVKWELDGNGKPKWIWRRPAHEVLVPSDPLYRSRPAHMTGLLFVHRKRFTLEDKLYSLRRHFDVLYKQYQGGKRDTTDLLYLANYAKSLAPHLEQRFLYDAHRASSLPIERSRALVELGNFAASRGLYQDAKEAFGAAVQFRADLPDAWVAGAEAALLFEDWVWASDWFQKSLGLLVTSESLMNPRVHALRTPLRCAQALIKVAEAQVEIGMHAQAQTNFDAAAQLAVAAAKNPCVDSDMEEMRSRAAYFLSAAESQRAITQAHALWDFLVRNDETQKAARLIEQLPCTVQDHPLAREMENWAAKVNKHESDPAAYVDFYQNISTTTDALPTSKDWLDPFKAPLPRTAWIGAWILKNRGDKHTFVLEVGCYDGIVGVPILRACKNVSYDAYDASQVALDRFGAFADELVEDKRARLTLTHGTDQTLPIAQLYDVAIFSEVVEHVPDPVKSVRELLLRLRPGGVLFLTTPWGAYDKAQRKFLYGKDQDPRGHVRALTARDVKRIVEAAGGRLVQQYNQRTQYGVGDTMHCLVEPALPTEQRAPVTFAVPSALWDWNSRSVEQTGIGASEEMIIVLAKELAKDRAVDVCGPVPEPEVHDGVGYWPREQLRFHKAGKVVVSRGASFADTVDAYCGKLPKILWLQDAHYPDLSTENVAKYESIVVVSEWHKQAMHQRHGVPLEKMHVIYNWAVPEHFAEKVEKLPHHFIYASSPDRGLIELLKLWPLVLKLYPDATLDIFYGWKGCAKLGSTNVDWARRFQSIREQFDILRWQKGVADRGMVPHVQIAKEFQKAAAWLYPTSFEETCCTNAIKARAGGCIPVCTPLAALNETALCPQAQFVPLDTDAEDGVSSETYQQRFIAAVQAAVETPAVEREKMSAEALALFGVEQAVAAWKKLL